MISAFREGDNIFVSADLMKVGYFNKNRVQTALDWLTIFQNIWPEWNNISSCIYRYIPSISERTPLFFERLFSNSGSLANAYIDNMPKIVSEVHTQFTRVLALGPLLKNYVIMIGKQGLMTPTVSSLIIKERTLCLEQLMKKIVQCPTIMHSSRLAILRAPTLYGLFKAAYVDEHSIEKHLLWMK